MSPALGLEQCPSTRPLTSQTATRLRPNRTSRLRVSCSKHEICDMPDVSRRSLLASVSGGMFLASVVSRPARATPFLESTGGRGFLAEEESRLYRLRQEIEGEAREELVSRRKEFEEEAKMSQIGKLCATPFGVDIVGITEFIALVGALVGGITARQRKLELERLNEQLRKINLSLRQQARAGTVYAPGLTYAPPSSTSTSQTPSLLNGTAVLSPEPTARTTTTTLTKPAPTSTTSTSTMFSLEEEELSPDQLHCKNALKSGKRLLKEQNGAAAMVRFEKALMLSKALGDKVQQRRAFRGLAAAARLQGQYRSAIKHLERVLEVSREMNEFTGDADAYGTIADCYTDLGDFERAAEFYDKYISCMNKGGPV